MACFRVIYLPVGNSFHFRSRSTGQPRTRSANRRSQRRVSTNNHNDNSELCHLYALFMRSLRITAERRIHYAYNDQMQLIKTPSTGI